MIVLRSDIRNIRSSEDIVSIRQAVRQWAISIGLSLVDQTKIVTAASELARNTIDYGGGGVLYIEIVNEGLRTGLKLTFEDRGPGILDINLAMKDGYTTSGGMGLGLGGSKRLVNEFEISSKVGEGTKISVIRWK